MRSILRDPVAKEHFLSSEGAIDSAMLRIAPKKAETGLLKQLEATMSAIKQVPWTQLDELKGDDDVLKRIDEAQSLLRTLRKNLSE